MPTADFHGQIASMLVHFVDACRLEGLHGQFADNPEPTGGLQSVSS